MSTAGWEQHVVRDGDGVVVDVSHVPGGESHEHMLKKAVLADQLDDAGHDPVELERRFPNGVQFDVFAGPTEHGRVSFGAEVGEINTPSRKFVERLRRSYEHVDVLVLWPKEQHAAGGMPPLKLMDAILSAHPHCETCVNESRIQPFAGTVSPWPIAPIPDQYCRPTMVMLGHLFEPGAYHAMLTEAAAEAADE